MLGEQSIKTHPQRINRSRNKLHLGLERANVDRRRQAHLDLFDNDSWKLNNKSAGLVVGGSPQGFIFSIAGRKTTAPMEAYSRCKNNVHLSKKCTMIIKDNVAGIGVGLHSPHRKV